ncbi:MAG TPA: ATP-binding protein [Actinomycetes bacterium]
MAGARGPAAAQASIQLPHAPSSARAARRFVAATLRGWRLDGVSQVVELLAGELVTNAITHTPASSVGIGLVVTLGGDAVRVEVHDTSPQLPKHEGMGGWDDEAGRGLELVAALATRWGSDIDGHSAGKAVWFEVHTA